MIHSLLKSKTVSTLLAGSGLLIILLLIMWMFMREQYNVQFTIIESRENTVIKMNIIFDMIQTARSRTRLTHKLIVEEDFFIKDEISTELNSLASHFAKRKSQFVSLPLNKFETDILDKQNKIIKVILKNQRDVVDMIVEETVESNLKAQQILFSKVTPGQGEVVDLFMQLIKYYESLILESTNGAREHNNDFNQLQIFFLAFFLLLATLIIMWTAKKILHIEKELKQERHLIHATLMSLADAVIIIDIKGIVKDCNQVAENILHKKRNELIGHSFANIATLSTQDKLINFDTYLNESIKNNFEPSLSDDIDLQFLNSEKVIHLNLLLSPVMDGNVKSGCIITFRDVSEKKKLEKKIHKQANYDALTGLMNRYSFEAKCQKLFDDYMQGDTHCLCVLDLDKFKRINDTCGHNAGDIVLKELSAIIKSCLRKGDTFARIGGDEFTIIFENCSSDDAQSTLSGVLNKIATYEYKAEEGCFQLGCSIGVAEIRGENPNYKDSFNQADAACYQAKDNGRNQVVIYTADQ